MPEIHIRLAISTDISILMGSDHSYESDYVWQLDLQRRPDQINTVLRQVRLPRSVHVTYPRDPFALADELNTRSAVLVAVSGSNRPIGYLCMDEQMSSALVMVTDLVVVPEMRRQGVATALLLAAQNWAVERNNRKMILEMQSKNHPAIQLAQKQGYEFCGYNDQYYANQDVALFFGRLI